MTMTLTGQIDPDSFGLCTCCIICGESVPLTQNEVTSLEYGHDIHSKVCDKCRAAVLRMRELMEAEVNGQQRSN